MIQLVCSDDGVGLPEDLGEVQTGLGMDIAEVVCTELECELDLQSRPGGVVASLVFKSYTEENGPLPRAASA